MDLMLSWVVLVFAGVQSLPGVFWLMMVIAVPMTPV